ncbi:RNA polymerase sigma factor [Kribbella sp. WER1]
MDLAFHAAEVVPRAAVRGRTNQADRLLLPSDAELLARCHAGDQDAWALLVGRYQRLVFTVARRNGLGRDDAADVTQSVFVALLEAGAAIRSQERLPSWLMTVARRQAWRLRSRHDHESPQPDPAADIPDELDWFADWEKVAVVHEALARLGQPCRDLLLWLYFDAASPSYAEIASRLGKAIGTVGPMRARCLQTLRRFLPEESL